MLIKFLDHGTGSAHKAAAYLLGEKDHAGEIRAEVRVLRGDPHLVSEVADSLEFKNRYTSGVFAFALEDKPTPEQIDALLDDFEKVAYAGLGAERGIYSAILHGEKNGACHIHIFAARVDLETGKSLNIAPPGWEKSYGALKNYYNALHGWADPDDPTRKRNLQIGKSAIIEASALRKGLKIEPDSKRLITDYLEQRIYEGFVRNRADVISALQEVGLEITRQGRDYISLKDIETGQKIRLKGAIYEQDFDITEQVAIKDTRGQGSHPRANGRSLEASRRDLDEAIRRRTKFNDGYYKKKESGLRGERKNLVQPGSKADDQDRLVDALPDYVNCGALRVDDPDDMAIPAHRIFQRQDNQDDSERRNQRDRIAQLERDEMRRRKHFLRRLQKMIESGVLIRDANIIYWNFNGKKTMAIVDKGDEIHIVNKTTDGKVRLLVATAMQKGWTGIHLFGDKEFQLKAAREALINGMIDVSGDNLTVNDVNNLKKDLENEIRNKRASSYQRDAASIVGVPGLHKLNSVYDQRRTDKSVLREDEPNRVRLQREPGRHDNQLLQPRNRRRRVQGRIINDRAGDVTVRSIDEIERAGEESRRRFDEAIRDNQQIIADVEKSSRSLDDASRRVAESSELVGQRNREEIHAFKTRLSIAKVAEGHGYVIDPKSTPALTIMRSKTDQIVIKKNPDDGVETFARSPAAGQSARAGTIIDFIQERENLSLGQVRRRLRPLLKQEDETAKMVAKLQSDVYQRAMKAIKDSEQPELPKPKT